MNAKKIEVTKIFDHNSSGYKNDWDWCMLFFKHTMNYCYDILRSKGYLFLNEVYEKFGFPNTKQGQLAGWVYDAMDKQEIAASCRLVEECWNNVFEIKLYPLENILDVLPEE